MQDHSTYHIDCIIASKNGFIWKEKLEQYSLLVSESMINPIVFSEKDGSHIFESRDTSKIYRAIFCSDSVALSGSISTISELAVKLRKIVPESDEMVVFDQAYNHSIEVSIHTNPIDIENAFLT